MNRELPSLSQQLLMAAQKNNKPEITRLLQLGVEINYKDKDLFNLNSALAIAAAAGHTDIAQILLECEASVNITNYHSNTPLHRAADKGHTAIVKLLLKYSADLNARGSDGYTSLYMATNNGHTEIIQILLEHGADPSIPTTDSCQVPLHIAAYKNNKAAVQLLLAWGATLDAKNNAHRTPLDLAVLKNNIEIFTLLHDYKVTLERVQNPTPQLFRYALTQGYYNLVKHLIKQDLPVNAHDLKLIYECYLQADKSYKSVYQALGRLLISYLRLTGDLPTQTPSQVYTTPHTISYPVAKQGLVGVRGLTKDIAEHIAHFVAE